MLSFIIYVLLTCTTIITDTQNRALRGSTRGDTNLKHTLQSAVAPIKFTGAHDITISGKGIKGGKLPAIHLINCYNIRITGNVLTNSTAVGIELYNCKNITIENNYISNVSTGVYADRCGEGILVKDNTFLNMTGPFPRGQFVQFNNVNGPNSAISYNKGENILGQSHAEDAISIYQSSGTAASPIKVDHNQIRGGGPSASGGGIMLGDSGGEYIIANDNILVNPGQYGMAISGGNHITIKHNTIYGKAQSFTNVGLYVSNPGKFSDYTVSDNRVLFFDKNGNQNNSWLAPGTTQPIDWLLNSFGAAIDESIIPGNFIGQPAKQ